MVLAREKEVTMNLLDAYEYWVDTALSHGLSQATIATYKLATLSFHEWLTQQGDSTMMGDLNTDIFSIGNPKFGKQIPRTISP